MKLSSKSLRFGTGLGLNSTGAVQSRTLDTLRRRPGPKGFLDAVFAVSGFRQSASLQTASVLPSAPLGPPSTGLGASHCPACPHP